MRLTTAGKFWLCYLAAIASFAILITQRVGG